MLDFIARRLVAIIPVLTVVAVLVFLMLRLTPGDPAAVIAGDNATSDQINDIREKLGLNEPIWTQFAIWIGNILQGNFGESFFFKKTVAELIAQRIERFAGIVGKERVIASTDCGFGTFAGYGKIDPAVAWKKLAALREGADIADRRIA